jgi:rare lipoprotein A
LPVLPIPDEWLQPALSPAEIAALPGATQVGSASWYGQRFQNRRKANGERFNRHELTTAHRTLPFGTQVRVTNLENNRSVVVTVTDRGPYSRNRIIDLSQAAAQNLDMIRAGIATVAVEVLSPLVAQQGRIEAAPVARPPARPPAAPARRAPTRTDRR